MSVRGVGARRVVIVGRGRMGAAFARALRAADVDVRVVRGRTLATASARGVRPAGRVTWLLAVTDRAVRDVAGVLVARAMVRAGDVVVHLAGMLGPDVLDNARAVGAGVGAMHPLVAVASPGAPPPLRDASVSFEGDGAARVAVRALARLIGLRVHTVERADRATYHAAAALVATGAVALAQGADALFREALGGVGHEARARDFVASLLRSVAHNVEVAGAAGALASPLLRGDTATVRRHLGSMQFNPRARAVYLASLAQVLETLDATRGVPESVLADGRELLAAEGIA